MKAAGATRPWCVMLALSAAPLCAQGISLPVTAPVQQLAAPNPTPTPAVAAPPSTPQDAPTTPSGKLPQYQMGHDQRQLPGKAALQDSLLGFQLMVSAGSVAMEARITIDGVPFAMQREQRINALMQQLAATDAADAVVERLRRYQQATGHPLTRDEVRWVLINWIDGPAVLWLNSNFQRFRANQQPAVAILDRDRDGSLSTAEIDRAMTSIQECDLNRDDIVQFMEIAKAAADPRHTPKSASQKLIAPHAEAGPPDMQLEVSFNTAHAEQSRITLLQAADVVTHAAVVGSVIQMKVRGVPVWLEAIQAGPSDQVSVGAVIDGYALLPELDPNDDGRFTIRELRGVGARLQSFDADRDGTLSASEMQTPIRIGIGLGPIVHRSLAGIRSVHPRDAASGVAAPEWFARMDRNKDNDLTRPEFPGTDQQFQTLDADGDHLISAAEAVASESKSETP